jgi:hypothetical protein
MSILFARKATVPLWVIVFALVVLFSPQAGVAPGMLLLVGGGLAVPAILAVLFHGVHHRTPAEVSRPVDAPPTVIGHPTGGIGRQRWSSRW